MILYFGGGCLGKINWTEYEVWVWNERCDHLDLVFQGMARMVQKDFHAMSFWGASGVNDSSQKKCINHPGSSMKFHRRCDMTWFSSEISVTSWGTMATSTIKWWGCRPWEGLMVGTGDFFDFFSGVIGDWWPQNDGRFSNNHWKAKLERQLGRPKHVAKTAAL